MDYEDQELDVVEMTDDEGNTVLCQVVDYFFYNGEEYVILSTDVDDEMDEDSEGPEEVDCFVMKVHAYQDEQGEEMEEFLPVEDADLEAKLIEVASVKLNEEDEEEEE